ncbi:DUF1285 domain-containing protein [Roseovarius sp. SCSIO 43702]|uniref:DUF1285 domain-containing protein n=1 Tax=Roseovarius sp. SCSIO 43702 TaxID=2823043 RepID=UPI001C72FE67|nr:DUF1285 domain-containing protein [Roseovarius sp. SCSIO 43702]QYX56591.1 DUF1285 domain-containing protein [Roseovarius sp. SCSIO 43702]
MSKEPITSTSAESLADAARAAQAKGGPPVEDWNPPLSGDMDMRIARDGTWYHEGARIERRGLVKVFSSILKREGEDYFLVTPVEKWRITVEDAPFVAVDVEAEGAGEARALIFETNVGDRVVAGPEHPIRVERDGESGEPAPYVNVRRNLEALIDRKSFYRLVEMGAHHEGWFGVWSDGVFFRFIPSEEMPS